MAAPPKHPGLTAYHLSSANASPNPSSPKGSQNSLLQSEMKARVEDQLKDASYTVDLTGESGCLRADPRVAQAVFDDLQTTFQALTSGGVSSATDPRLPNDKFLEETASYEPVAHLINKIIDTANRHITGSHLRGLRFYPFRQEMNEKYGSRKPLKPDGVGIMGELPLASGTKKSDLSWEQVEAAFESKKDVPDMVRQSGTYARSCIMANQTRFFALGVGFNYISMDAYIFVFHRAGLSSSPGLDVRKSKGLKGLVDHVVGILSLNKANYGLDSTRFQNFFVINNKCYEIVCILHMRGSLRGRSTTVYSLKGMCMRILSAGLHLSAYPAVDMTPPHDIKSRMLTLSKMDYLPDKLTYKLTYQIRGRSQEGPLFSQFTGQFGIADVIGYHECGPEDPHGSTMRFMNGAKFWNVFGREEGRPDPEPEDRGLHCIALSGEGKALIDVDNPVGGTPSPGELLESILHAIIGK